MQRGWLRVMVRYPLVVVEQGRLSQEEAAREMGLSTRRVRRVLKRYRESGQRLESLAYQRRHSAWNALPRSTKEEIQRLQREYPRWSAPAIAEVLAATEGVVVHRATRPAAIPPRILDRPGDANGPEAACPCPGS